MRFRQRILLQLVAIVAVLFLAGGCSQTQKLLKSGDPQLIYGEALKYYQAEEWSKASQLFEGVSPYFTGSFREDTVLFCNARCKFKLGDYMTSAQLMDEFRRQFGRSEYIEDAEGIYTLSYYYISPAPERDQTLTKTAIMAIDEFLSRYPASAQKELFVEIRAELMQRLYDKSYMNAYTYFKIGRYKSAIVAFRNAMKEYPESPLREELSFYTVASAYNLANKSVLLKKEDRYLTMLDNYYTFIAEFPNSSHLPEVEAMARKARRYIASVKDGTALVKPNWWQFRKMREYHEAVDKMGERKPDETLLEESENIN